MEIDNEILSLFIIQTGEWNGAEAGIRMLFKVMMGKGSPMKWITSSPSVKP